MADFTRCINKDGKERFIPTKLTKDRMYMSQYELTIQDKTQNEKMIEAIIPKEPITKEVSNEGVVKAGEDDIADEKVIDKIAVKKETAKK